MANDRHVSKTKQERKQWRAAEAQQERARAHWATLTPEEQVEALRAGRTPFAQTAGGDGPQRYPTNKGQGKKDEVYRAGKAVSGGLVERDRRRH
jgi:hypothetical protein